MDDNRLINRIQLHTRTRAHTYSHTRANTHTKPYYRLHVRMPTCLRSNKVEYYLSKGLFNQWERTLMVLSSSQPSPLSSALPLILSFSLAILSSLPYYSPLLSRGLPKIIADNKRQLGDVCLRTALFAPRCTPSFRSTWPTARTTQAHLHIYARGQTRRHPQLHLAQKRNGFRPHRYIDPTAKVELR